MTGLAIESVPPRRLAGWALVGGLCLAAVVAILALLTGSFDDTDGRIIGTSLGFSVASATAAAGETLRRAGRGRRRLAGAATTAVSAGAWLTLVGSLWIDGDPEWLWRTCGCLALLALAGSHASLVLQSERAEDGALVHALCGISIVAAAIDTAAGLLGLSGAIDGVDDSVVTALAVLLIVFLLATALPPILRRLQGSRPAERPPLSRDDRLAERIDAVAARLGPELAPAAEELRRVARELGR